ncbi:ABC transporter ATP-binding protein [Catenuloplanes atrovinosus]|uniref:ATP-binding cassette subfamily B protein n=1 Tax=Catenuloplanes atrovinosus TaxID=137266 RepID=A0AAE4C9Z4_9ACTN|nr:ABC transporter ATP-binding protein [Catenuloplanes atrovinosus]MDR7277076.1 ATP-binding cassette subfamily B protein [Catenuloplanes atrovinosus]
MTVVIAAGDTGDSASLPARQRWRIARQSLLIGLRAAPGGYAALAALALLAGGAAPVAAWLMKLLIDRLAAGTPGAVPVLLLALGAALTGGAVLVIGEVSMYLGARVQRAVTLRVQSGLSLRVNRLIGLRYFEEPAHQDRLRLASQAADITPNEVVMFGLEVLRQTVAVAGFAGTLMTIWPPIGLLLLAALVPAYLGQRATARRHAAAAQTISPVQRRQYYYRSLLTERHAAKEVRLFGLGALFHGRMIEALTRGVDVELSVQRRAALIQSLLALLNGVVGGVGVGVVAWRAAAGGATVGDVGLFVAAVAAMQSAIGGLLLSLGRVQAGLLLMRHYTAVMEAADDLTDGTRPAAPLTRGIELRDVWFRYTPDGPWVLRGVDLTIPAGQAIGVVGLNGAGKTTLVKLLCRLYDPERGAILWDGVDIRDLSAETLRRRISATFQDFVTYDLTVRENIGVGALEHLDDAGRVRSAAELGGLAEAVDHLPRRYDTMVSLSFLGAGDDRGVMLSGGQLQRLAIARSVLRDDADLLILDEPSAGLDAVAEHHVHRTLAARRAGRTSLLVSHRLGALRDADLIVVLDAGRITERGTHDELMSLDGGRYASLFRLQATTYQDARVPRPGDVVIVGPAPAGGA